MPENIQKNNQSTGNIETQKTAKASKSSKLSKKKVLVKKWVGRPYKSVFLDI